MVVFTNVEMCIPVMRIDILCMKFYFYRFFKDLGDSSDDFMGRTFMKLSVC